MSSFMFFIIGPECRYITIVGIIAFLLIPSCDRNVNKQEFAGLRWLEGNWKSIEESQFYESWEMKNGNVMEGFGCAMKNGDTLMSESLRISESDSGIFYSAVVSDQNDRLPVHFKLIHHFGDSLVFSNPTHDFPRIIVYKRIAADSLMVYVRDGLGSLSKGFTLHMVKSKSTENENINP